MAAWAGDGGLLSIHDLTRRSTHHGILFKRVSGLSIHDLTRRSTILVQRMLYK